MLPIVFVALQAFFIYGCKNLCRKKNLKQFLAALTKSIFMPIDRDFNFKIKVLKYFLNTTVKKTSIKDIV